MEGVRKEDREGGMEGVRKEERDGERTGGRNGGREGWRRREKLFSSPSSSSPSLPLIRTCDLF